MTENVLVVAPGDDRAKKIAKAIASSTAGEILTTLRDGRQTATQIADRLSLPMTTVQYHLENLVEAEMLEIAEKRWSKKGREVKVYALRDQLVIVASPTADLRALLSKYAALFSIIAALSIMIMIWAPLIGATNGAPAWSADRSASSTTPAPQVTVAPTTSGVSPAEKSGENVQTTGGTDSTGAGEDYTLPSTELQQPVTAPPVQPPVALFFFLGGFAVLFLVMSYEMVIRPWLQVRVHRMEIPPEEE